MSGLVSKLGTIVRLADGRIGTTVYYGLDGIGIKWGRHNPQMEDFEGTSGNCVEVAKNSPAREPDWPWTPDAMLRDPYPCAELECVGQDYEVLVDDEREKMINFGKTVWVIYDTGWNAIRICGETSFPMIFETKDEADEVAGNFTFFEVREATIQLKN